MRILLRGVAWILALTLPLVGGVMAKGPDWLQTLDSHPWPEASVTRLLAQTEGVRAGASPQGDADRLQLAILYWHLGRYDEAGTLLYPLWYGLSSAPNVTAAAAVLWPLLWSDIEMGKDEWVSSINQLALAVFFLSAPMPHEQWTGLAWLVKRRQFELVLWMVPIAAEMDALWTLDEASAEYPRDLLLMLFMALRPDGAVLEEGQLSVDPGRLKVLGAFRPWKDALLRRAATLSDELHNVDLAMLESGELASAARRNREASLLAARGQPHEAMALRRAAAGVFRRLNRPNLRAEALAGAVRDALAIGSFDALSAAYADGTELVALHEQRMARLASAVGRYQVRHFEDYRLVRELLLRLHRLDAVLPDELSSTVRWNLALLADSLQLRPARRQLEMYRLLADDFAVRQRLQAEVRSAKLALSRAATELVLAQTEGLGHDDLRAAEVGPIVETMKVAKPGETIQLEAGVVSAGKPMTSEAGPYVKLQAVRHSVTRIMEDGVRAALQSQGVARELPSDAKGLTSGMTAQDAIVLFFETAMDKPLHAAVITPGTAPRIVQLLLAQQDIKALVAQATAGLAANVVGRTAALRQLSEALWQPLGHLPERLTIVPNLTLIGLPFEALPLADGHLVVDGHSVRYAIGLDDGIARATRLRSTGAVLALGAVTFTRQHLDPLGDAGAELDGLRALLRGAGARVEPAQTLPATGTALLSATPGVSLVHVATHAVWDSVDPMFDRLAFPEDDVLAVEAALSPLDADLVIFSACALLRNRGRGSQPVSGLSTAALAAMAPRLITTLWSVESRSTRLFMTAFHETFLREREPGMALALTKRLFRNPTSLAEWAAKHGETVDAQTLSAPYHWAAFALVVRGD